VDKDWLEAFEHNAMTWLMGPARKARGRAIDVRRYLTDRRLEQTALGESQRAALDLAEKLIALIPE